MSDDSQRIFYSQFTTTDASVTMFEELLMAIDLTPATMRDAKTGVVQVRLYAETPDVAALYDAQVRAVLPEWADLLDDEVVCDGLGNLEREDWAESWKRHFQVLRPSPHLVIRPSWEPVEAVPGIEIITLDPGMSFGTGQHPTTRACLAYLDLLRDQVPPDAGFLDIGCGSGILAISAARLGYSPVVAFDHDPLCLTSTTENAATNGVADRVAVACADLKDWKSPRLFRVVAANLFAHVLIDNAAAIQRCLPPAGNVAGPSYLLIAGILNEQYQGVLDAFAPYGFVERERDHGDEWSSGCLVRV